MIHIVKPLYHVELNDRSGTVDRLYMTHDMNAVNLVHKDPFAAFGSLSVSPRNKPWRLEDTASPIGKKSYVFPEQRFFSQFVRRENDQYEFMNSQTGHRSVYRFDDQGFELRTWGDFPQGDQIALDLNMAFLDLRQNDPEENQFTVKSFYTGEDRSLCYVYLARVCTGEGILIHSLAPGAVWRLRYGRSPAIDGLQFVFRFSEQIDPSAHAGEPVDACVYLSFHRSDSPEKTFRQALEFLAEREDLPLLDVPVKSAFAGQSVDFSLRGEAELELYMPDGVTEKLIPETRKIRLPAEGFYRLTSRNRAGKTYEVVLHGALDYFKLLERSRSGLTPIFRSCNAECYSWVQAMCLAHLWIGPDPRMNDYLHDALICVGRQGLPGDSFPGRIPPPEESRTRMEKRLPGREHYATDGKFMIGAPAPFAHECDGQHYPKGHIYQSHRIQDGFAFIHVYLYAAKAFRCDTFYEYAVEIAKAHLEPHLCEDGAIRRLSVWEQIQIDYTTVICPLLSCAELYREMMARNDPRAAEIGECCLKIADYLLKRGLQFPTEGTGVHMRWTEDGSIACTALSLLAAYHWIKPDKRYLDMVEKVLRYHEYWHIQSNDVRCDDTTFRYWETQWENEGEGHSFNSGHAWNLWRGEALFLYAEAVRNFDAFRQSFNAYQANLCNHHPDGRTSSCFTPDYLPERPGRLDLYHCFPRQTDRAMSFYVWPRLYHTWLETVVIRQSLDGPTEVLNGYIENSRLIPSAPHLNRIYLFGEVSEIDFGTISVIHC